MAWNRHKNVAGLKPVNRIPKLYCRFKNLLITVAITEKSIIRSTIFFFIYGRYIQFLFFQLILMQLFLWFDFDKGFQWISYISYGSWVKLDCSKTGEWGRWTEFKLTTLVVIGTDCTCSCKSNYHTIMTMTAPFINKMR
jgi:hypothetical protein